MLGEGWSYWAEKKILEINFEFWLSETSTQANTESFFVLFIVREKKIKLRKYYSLTVIVLDTERLDLLDMALIL